MIISTSLTVESTWDLLTVFFIGSAVSNNEKIRERLIQWYDSVKIPRPMPSPTDAVQITYRCVMTTYLIDCTETWNVHATPLQSHTTHWYCRDHRIIHRRSPTDIVQIMTHWCCTDHPAILHRPPTDTVSLDPPWYYTNNPLILFTPSTNAIQTRHCTVHPQK